MSKVFDDYHDPSGLAGFLLGMNTMLMLEKKGVLSHEEVKEIVEQALLNLETQQATMGPEAQKVFESARGILESLRTIVSRPSEQR
jgi:hypothetical protein